MTGRGAYAGFGRRLIDTLIAFAVAVCAVFGSLPAFAASEGTVRIGLSSHEESSTMTLGEKFPRMFRVRNVGTLDCFVKFKVSSLSVERNALDWKYSLEGNGWANGGDGWWYLNTALEPGVTAQLELTLDVPTHLEGAFAGGRTVIREDVIAEAVQADEDDHGPGHDIGTGTDIGEGTDGNVGQLVADAPVEPAPNASDSSASVLGASDTTGDDSAALQVAPAIRDAFEDKGRAKDSAELSSASEADLSAERPVESIDEDASPLAKAVERIRTEFDSWSEVGVLPYVLLLLVITGCLVLMIWRRRKEKEQ